MTTPYAVRRINVTLGFGKGTYGQDGTRQQLTFNSVNPGLRISVHIETATAPDGGQAQIRVYGLSLDHMNQMSRAGLVYEAREGNTVQIDAGDDDEGMSTIFAGLVVEAYPDMKNMPDTPFYILATPSAIPQTKPVDPTSFQGPTKAADALGAIAKKAGLTLENNGVDAVLASPYFDGGAWSQLRSCVFAANCFGFLDGVKKVFAVWKKNGSRAGASTTISPDTGMIGYPQFQFSRVLVRVLFSPSLKSLVGQTITIRSQLEAANGQFVINTMTYELMSEMPDGPWEAIITANPLAQK